MRRIIFGLLTITAASAVIVSGLTGAFFSDTETSTGNTFAAGAIDLKVDNQSYYNGVLSEATSWGLDDLDNGRLFFNFLDLKPDDEGEDTISLHVENDAWACMDISLTSNDDNSSTEPELLVDTQDMEEDIWDGELAQNIQMFWWADDGDNVYEVGENPISDSVQTLYGLATTTPFKVALADSQHNVWTGTPGPMIAGEMPYYIAKAWCLGTLTLNPVPDGQGVDPTVAPGVSCDGTMLNNLTQTDGATLDIVFRAVQARHNDDFRCINCTINTEVTLVPDSGFENPEVTSTKKWDIFDSPAGAWSVAWRDDIPSSYNGQTRPDPAHLEIHEGVLGTPFEGDQYAELDSDWGGPDDSRTGEPASVKIYQDVVTIPGENYQIRFAFAPRPNTPASDNRLEVRWGGNVVYDSGNVADPNAGIEWQEVVVDVTATSALTELAFTDLGTANSLGTFIDDIRLYREVCE